MCRNGLLSKGRTIQLRTPKTHKSTKTKTMLLIIHYKDFFINSPLTAKESPKCVFLLLNRLSGPKLKYTGPNCQQTLNTEADFAPSMQKRRKVSRLVNGFYLSSCSLNHFTQLTCLGLTSVFMLLSSSPICKKI